MIRRDEYTVAGRAGVLGVCLFILAAAPPTALGALWTPSEVEVIAWYDASETNTILHSGGKVTNWLDKGTNSLTLTTSGVNYNTVETGIRTINDMNVMHNDAGRGCFMRSLFPCPSSGNVSVFMLAAIDSVDSGDNSAFTMNDGSGYIKFGAGSDVEFKGNISSQNYGDLGNLTNSAGPYDGQTNVFDLVLNYSASTCDIYVDGINRGNKNTYTTKVRASDNNLYLFRGSAGSKYVNSPNGAIAEVVLIEDCSERTRVLLEGYLAHKWGLADNLPADHRYKRTPPLIRAGTVMLIQ